MFNQISQDIEVMALNVADSSDDDDEDEENDNEEEEFDEVFIITYSDTS